MRDFKKLSRDELRNVFGNGNVRAINSLDGGGSCRVTVRYPGGGFGRFDTPTSGSCSNQSSQANQQYLTLIGNSGNGTRCSYDCACDGYGQ